MARNSEPLGGSLNGKFGVAALAAALALAPARAALASNEDAGFGARAMAMGDAVSADTEGLSALTLNPAALGRARRTRVEFGIHRLFQIPAGSTDLSGMTIGAGMPLGRENQFGAFGFHYRQDEVAPVALDRTFGFTYATRSWREIGEGKLDVGGTLKVIRRTGSSVQGRISRAAADIGAIYGWGDDQTVGLSVLNVNSPRTSFGALEDKAPAALKAGYARKVRRFTVAADLTRREDSAAFDSAFSAAGAIEYSLATIKYGMFSPRTGLSLGGKSRSWSAGLGWRILGGRLDYAFRVPLSGGSRWSNAFSIAYEFGSWNTEAEYEKLLETEMGHRRDLTRALESAEIKQWKFAEDLRLMREEMDDLRRELALRAAEVGKTRDSLRKKEQELRLKKLEEKRRKAQKRLEEMKLEQERLRRLDKEGRFQDDWRAYKDFKSRGVSEVLLIERLKTILRQYKGTGVDLGEPSLELQRLSQ